MFSKEMFIKSNSGYSNKGYYIIGVILFLLFLFLHIPVCDQYFNGSLDPSWMYVLQWSQSNNIQFGSEFIFTYGPLSYLLINKDILIYTQAIFVWIFFMFIFFPFFITNNLRQLIVAIIFILLTFQIPLFDIIAYSITFISVVTVYKVEKKLYAIAYTVFIVIASSMLIYIKFMFFPIVLLTTIFLDIILFKRYKMPFATLMLIISTLIVWFIISVNRGGSFTEIIPFFKMSFMIMSGYTEAMIAAFGFPIEIFILFNIFIITILILTKKIYYKVITDKLFFTLIFLSLMGALFLGFKHGFVRHDGHVVSTYIAIIVSIAMLISLIRYYAIQKKSIYTIIIFTVVVLLSSNLFNRLGLFHYLSIPRIPSIISQQIGVLKSIGSKDLSIANESKSQIAIFDKNIYDNNTVDLYPYMQGYLLASGLNYKPRPIFQSYSAYTPDLLKANADSLLKEDSPEYIFWQVLEIDGRLPSLMDGASWNNLLGKYELMKTDGEFLVFKNTHKNDNIKPLKEISRNKFSFNKPITIPKSDKLLYATIDIKYNILGKLLTFLWRPPEVDMVLFLDNKTMISHRVIPGMMKTPFLLSPYVGYDYITKRFDFINLTEGNSMLPKVEKIELQRNINIGRLYSRFTKFISSLVMLDSFTVTYYESENYLKIYTEGIR